MFARSRIIAGFIALLGFTSVCAQQSKVDSLKPILAQHSDTSRIYYLLLMGEAYMEFSPKRAIEPAGEAKTLAAQVNDQKKEANALLLMGRAYSKTGNMTEAISCFDQSVALMKKVGTDEEVGDLLINAGNTYNAAGAYDEALTASLDAYKIFEKADDKRGMARSLIVSGNVYRKLNNFPKAVTDYDRALNFSREVHDASLEASCLLNLAAIYSDKGEFDAALRYNLDAKRISEHAGDQYNLAKTLNNIGGVYLDKAQDSTYIDGAPQLLDTALQYYFASLEIKKQLGDRRGQVSCFNNLGAVSLLAGNPDKAIEYFQRGLDIAKELQALDYQMTLYENLHEAYVRKNDIEKALFYYKEYTALKDSIYSKDMREGIAEMQAIFDVEKAEAETRATEEQKKIIIWSSVIGGVLFIVIIFFIWRQSIDRKKANIALNEQKVEIELKNVALNAANLEIELKNKDITDSIRYARRIQEAILPELEFATTFGRSGFVLYKPKDIVSGDFYWMAKKGDLLLFAAVDCTGHGVPGAFVSIVCSNLLTQAVNEYGFHEPDDILNDVNARLSVTLRQRLDESKVRDGMDIALCSLNMSTGKLHFAGAFNPAWIMRKGEIIELKADKFPVGNFEDEALRVFVRQEIQLQKGDRIYVFSDGYSDQFGGASGKKYKRVQFIEFLKKIQAYPIHEHKGLLEREHIAWKGQLEQIDDIVVMGAEFPVHL